MVSSWLKKVSVGAYAPALGRRALAEACEGILLLLLALMLMLWVIVVASAS